ncbi:MAG: DNA primase [Ruminiclostridium sp.]|nr:DNA primase [Ruminiclostridium sp.]
MISKNKINENLFCREFCSHHPLVFDGNDFRDKNGKVNIHELKNEIYRILSTGVCTKLSRTTEEILGTLKNYCYTKPLPPQPEYIHINGGKIDLSGNFYNNIEFCSNRLTVEYIPDIWRHNLVPTHFLDYLNSILASDDILTLQEYLGYLLIPSTKGQKMLFIVGKGGEGKSRLNLILKHIFGDSMLCANSKRIETDRFFMYNLRDKLLLVDDDLNWKYLSTTGTLKTLITAETPIEVEAKGIQSFQYLIYTRLLCFSNYFPRSLYDKSDGFTRRLIILTTVPKSKDRKDDPFIAERFLGEKNIIFYWAFQGLQRLIKNNYEFTISEKTKLNLQEIIKDSCNIIDFLSDNERIVISEGYSVTSRDLYNSYKLWCKDNALSAMKIESFIAWLKENADTLKIKFSYHITNGESHVRGFKGIGIKY